MKNIFIFSILLMLSTVSAVSQVFMQEKRIYLFDVTASMEGKGAVPTPNVFSEVKNNLLKSVHAIKAKDVEIVLIPFTSKPLEKYSLELDSIKEIEECVNNLSIKTGDTNIADAWAAGLQEIDSTKLNYLFLITDGLHNTGPGKDVLYNHIDEWYNFAKDNYYFAFYVMLTPQAKEQEIVHRIHNSKQIWAIESMDINAVFIQTHKQLVANIYEDKHVVLAQYASVEYDTEKLLYSLRLEENPYYEISNVQVSNTDNTILLVDFDVKEKVDKMEIPISLDLNLNIEYDQEKYPLLFFTPEQIDFKVINRGIRKMTIKQID